MKYYSLSQFPCHCAYLEHSPAEIPPQSRQVLQLCSWPGNSPPLVKGTGKLTHGFTEYTHKASQRCCWVRFMYRVLNRQYFMIVLSSGSPWKFLAVFWMGMFWFYEYTFFRTPLKTLAGWGFFVCFLLYGYSFFSITLKFFGCLVSSILTGLGNRVWYFWVEDQNLCKWPCSAEVLCKLICNFIHQYIYLRINMYIQEQIFVDPEQNITCTFQDVQNNKRPNSPLNYHNVDTLRRIENFTGLQHAGCDMHCTEEANFND